MSAQLTVTFVELRNAQAIGAPGASQCAHTTASFTKLAELVLNSLNFSNKRMI